MATGATGTPTARGIPKYNTSVDSPSGQGFNSAMDAIDALLGVKARKNSAGSVFQRGRFNFIEGSGITLTVADDSVDDEIDVTIAAASSAPGYGTSLPGSPTDGQQYILVDSTTLPTYQWLFRYNNGSSNSDKWEFIGGSPALTEVATSEGTTSTTYAALATAGPSFTVPRAGVYEVTIGSNFITSLNGTDAAHSYDIGGTGAVDADAILWGGQDANEQHSMVFTKKQAGLAASTALVSKYKTSAGTTTFQKRWMMVVPIRVS